MLNNKLINAKQCVAIPCTNLAQVLDNDIRKNSCYLLSVCYVSGVCAALCDE